MRDFKLSLGDVANILSLGFLVALVVTLSAGIIADRFGRRLSLVLFLSLSALFVAATGFARTGAFSQRAALWDSVSGTVCPQ